VFLTIGIIAGKRELSGTYFITLFILLLIFFIVMMIWFIKREEYQGILEQRFIRKIILILLPMGFIFILMLGFLMQNNEDDHIVWGTIDSVSYYIQAKIFSTGHINVPSHALKDFFSTGFCINDGKYYSKYSPGWPILLSIGITMGLPWIINPIFGILTIILIYFIGMEIYDKETGLFAAVLLLSSRYFYILTPTYFSEPSALFFSGLFVYCIVRTLKKPKVMTSFLAGLILGILFLIRPYSAVAISLPTMGYLFLSSLKGKRKNISSFLVVFFSFLPILSLFFLYNYLQTGSVFLTPFQYYNPSDTFGFGLRSFDTIIDPYPYTIFNAVRNMFINLAILNLESVPFLILFFILVFKNKVNNWDILLFATFASVVLLQMFYFYREVRYYYPVFFALSLLAARGINLSGVFFKKYYPNTRVKNLNHFILLFIIFANLLVIISPQKVLYDYRSAKKMRDPFDMVRERNIHNSVIFLRTVPIKDNYTALYVQNPLDFNGDILFVKDLKERNLELMEYYPKREFYFYDFDFKSKSGKLTKINRNGKIQN
jgi:hypothetical protein